jgi:histone H3/H4
MMEKEVDKTVGKLKKPQRKLLPRLPVLRAIKNSKSRKFRAT